MSLADLPTLSVWLVGATLVGVFFHLLFDADQWRGALEMPLSDAEPVPSGEEERAQ